MLLNILLDLGITNYNNRNISQNTQLLSKHFSNLVVLKCLLAVVYFVVAVIVALIIGYSSLQIKFLVFLAFNQFLLSFILYLRSNLAGLHLFKTDSMISVLDRVILIVLCSLLLWGNITRQKFQIEWLIYAQTLAYLFTAGIAFFLVVRKTVFIRLKFDKQFFIVILRQSFPFALLTLLMLFYTRIDSVMLERMLTEGKAQAGIYAQSFRILDAMAMFAFLFASLLLPIFSRMIKNSMPVLNLVNLSSSLLLVPSFIFIISCFVYRVEIMDLLYHHHVEESSSVFGILIFGFLSIAVSYIFGTLLTANGNLRQLNIIAFFGVISSVILNLIFIPWLYALGAAIASLITQTLTALLQVWFADRVFNILSKKLILMIKIVMLALFIFLPGLLLRDNLENWIPGFFLLIIFGLGLAFLMRLICIRNIYEIFKYGDISD